MNHYRTRQIGDGAPPELPSNRVIAATVRYARAEMPWLVELMDRLGVSVADSFRFQFLAERLRYQRERMGLTVKDAAIRSKIPQYRIKEAETCAGGVVDLRFFARYVAFLGAEARVSEWCRAYPRLARSSGVADVVKQGTKPVRPAQSSSGMGIE